MLVKGGNAILKFRIMIYTCLNAGNHAKSSLRHAILQLHLISPYDEMYVCSNIQIRYSFEETVNYVRNKTLFFLLDVMYK